MVGSIITMSTIWVVHRLLLHWVTDTNVMTNHRFALGIFSGTSHIWSVKVALGHHSFVHWKSHARCVHGWYIRCPSSLRVYYGCFVRSAHREHWCLSNTRVNITTSPFPVNQDAVITLHQESDFDLVSSYVAFDWFIEVNNVIIYYCNFHMGWKAWQTTIQFC